MFIPIVYGSNGGKSATIAGVIKEHLEGAEKMGQLTPIRCTVGEMNRVEIEKMKNLAAIVFVCSTTGDGECPYNMQRFWKEIKRVSWNGVFSNLYFSVVALGDSSYAKYNYAGKMLFNRIKQIGGTPLCGRCDCDDMDEQGVYTALYPWLSLLKHSILRLEQKNYGYTSEYGYENGYSFFAKKDKVDRGYTLLEKRQVAPYGVVDDLAQVGSIYSEVLDLVFHAKEEEEYSPGDVLEIYPENIDYIAFVEEVVIEETTDSSGEAREKHTGKEECGRFRRLDYQKVPMFHEIRKVYNYFLAKEIVFRHTVPDRCLFISRLEEISKTYGEYYTYILRPQKTFREFLRDFYLQVPLNTDIFTEIFPRYYTISKKERSTYSITVGVIKRYTNLSVPRKGVCSAYLKELSIGSRVCASIKKSLFKLEGNLFMLCTGTGISLPRAAIAYYLQNKTTSIKGITAVIGFRMITCDFLYKEEFKISDAEIVQGRNGFFIRYSVFSHDKQKHVTVILCPSRVKSEIEELKRGTELGQSLKDALSTDLPGKNYLTEILYLLNPKELEKQVIISGSSKTSKALLPVIKKIAGGKVKVYTECW